MARAVLPCGATLGLVPAHGMDGEVYGGSGGIEYIRTGVIGLGSGTGAANDVVLAPFDRSAGYPFVMHRIGIDIQPLDPIHDR